ncbi:MAG: Uma2 family endonuclease [Symploca sp. SIO2E6]|nr:Uma2 family endonuclease [Symploca sp. SIO2E6]
MLQYKPLSHLPTAEELPETDHQPVDSELQIWVSTLLAILLNWLWKDRNDWFWGVNLGIYYDQKKSAIVPDGFLSLGVELVPSEEGRLSYVLWQENDVVPLLVLEYVSKTYGQEYDQKMADYAQMGVLYYVVYNPIWHRQKHKPLEMYRLVKGKYVLQTQEPMWIEEMGLGIGRGRGTFKGWTREWLYWFDREGNRLLAPDEAMVSIERQLQQEYRQRLQAQLEAQQAQLEAQQERQQRQQAQLEAQQERQQRQQAQLEAQQERQQRQRAQLEAQQERQQRQQAQLEAQQAQLEAQQERQQRQQAQLKLQQMQEKLLQSLTPEQLTDLKSDTELFD